MADHPFNLKGTKILSRGDGKPDNAKHQSNEFTLTQGVAILETWHKGTEEFKITLDSKKGSYEIKREGAGHYIDAFLVTEEDLFPDHEALAGDYKFIVQSASPWQCRLIQPDLGQSYGDFIKSWQRPLTFKEDGTHIAGPYKVGTKPVLGNFIKEGHGDLTALAYSLDGTDYAELCNDKGQFLQNDIQLSLKPNKEYMIIIYSDGPWQFWCSEGY